jgi:hypothetical protein
VNIRRSTTGWVSRLRSWERQILPALPARYDRGVSEAFDRLTALVATAAARLPVGPRAVLRDPQDLPARGDLRGPGGRRRGPTRSELARSWATSSSRCSSHRLAEEKGWFGIDDGRRPASRAR